MKITYTEEEVREIIAKATFCDPATIKFHVIRDDGARLGRSDFKVEVELQQNVEEMICRLKEFERSRTLEDKLAACRKWELSDLEVKKLEE